MSTIIPRAAVTASLESFFMAFSSFSVCPVAYILSFQEKTKAVETSLPDTFKHTIKLNNYSKANMHTASHFITA
jgi:hypothetical protein